MTSGSSSSNAPGVASNSINFRRCWSFTTSESAASTVSVSVLVPRTSLAAFTLAVSISNEVLRLVAVATPQV